MNKFGNWLLKDRRYAAAIALLFSLLPLLGIPTSWMASVIIAFVALQKGLAEGLFVVLWACLPAVVLWYLGGSILIISLFVLQYLLVCYFSSLWRQYKSLSLVLELAAGFGFISLILISLFVEGLGEYWLQIVTDFIKASIPDQSEMLKDFVIKASAGIMMTLLLISLLVNVLMARAWQSSIFKPGAFTEEFVNIRAGKVISAVFLFCILGAILNIDVAFSCAFVTAIPMVFGGIALVHGILLKRKNKIVWLILFYATLVLFSIYFLPLLVMVGLIDTWFNLRKRMR